MPSPPRRAPSPMRWRAPTSCSAFRSKARSQGDGAHDGRSSRSSSLAPTPILRSRPKRSRRCAPTRSSRPAAPTIPTRSTIFSAFPYIFRGALDVRAPTINDEMKIAAVYALAELAREEVPDEVAAAYAGTPADLRAGLHHPRAVRSAADQHIFRRLFAKPRWIPALRASRSSTWQHYRQALSARLDPTANFIQLMTDKARAEPKRVVFAEGEEEAVIRAAMSLQKRSAWRADPDRPRGAIR